MKSQKPSTLTWPSTNLWGKKICMYGMDTTHRQGQVSGSMNADPINMIDTGKTSKKGGLKEELDEYFRSIKQ